MQKVSISAQREIHVQKKVWRGQESLDIRTYIKTANYTGYTQKGIMVPLEKAKEVQEAIGREIG